MKLNPISRFLATLGKTNYFLIAIRFVSFSLVCLSITQLFLPILAQAAPSKDQLDLLKQVEDYKKSQANTISPSPSTATQDSSTNTTTTSQTPQSQAQSCQNPGSDWVEVSSKRDQYSKTLAIPLDNNAVLTNHFTPEANPTQFKYVACISSVPQFYKDGSNWKAIDTSIKALTGTRQDDFGWKSETGNFTVYFGKSKPLFAYTEASASIATTDVTIGGQVLTTDSSKVSLNKNLITYSEVLPGVDLIYTVLPTGVSKQFVLKNESALNNDWSEVDFGLQTSHLERKTTGTSETTSTVEIDKDVYDTVLDIFKKVKQNPLNAQQTWQNLDSAKRAKIKKKLSAGLDGKDADPANLLKQAKSLGVDLTKTDGEQVASLIWKLSTKTPTTKPSTIKNISIGEGSSPTKTKITIITNQPESALVLSDTQQLEQPVLFDNGGLVGQRVEYELQDNTLKMYPNISILNDTNRSFPIVLDPGVIGVGQASGDSFVRRNAATSAQGVYNKGFLSVGGNFFDNTTGTSLDTSRIFVQFQLPAEIANGASVGSSQLGVIRYATSNQGFNADVRRVDSTFDENTLTWNNQPAIQGTYGQMDFTAMINQNGANGGQLVWSSDIGGLVRDTLNQGRRTVVMSLVDPNESIRRGVAICSKDTYSPTHPCDQVSDGPYLNVFYNQTPTPPSLERVDNVQYIGQCNLSSGSTSGDCNPTSNLPYRIGNINDGDHGAYDPATRAWVNLYTNSLTAFGAYGEAQLTGFMGPYGGYKDFNYFMGNGWYKLYAKNGDEYGAISAASNSSNVLFDTTPPGYIPNVSQVQPFQTGNVSLQPTYTDNVSNLAALQVDPRAMTPGSFFNFVNMGNGKVMDYGIVNNAGVSTTVGGDTGDLVHLWSNANVANQKWGWDTTGGAIYNGDGSRCLRATPDLTTVVSGNNCGNANSSWDYVWEGQNAGLIKLRTNQGGIERCLSTGDINSYGGTGIVIRSCDNQDISQLWRLNGSRASLGLFNTNRLRVNASYPEAGAKLAYSDLGTIQVYGSNAPTSGCVENMGGSGAGIIQINPCNNSANQLWDLDNQGRIKLRGTNYCIEFPFNQNQDLYITTCSNGSNQKWVWHNQDVVTINARSGSRINAVGGTNGTLAQTAPVGTTNEAKSTQKFIFSESKFFRLANNTGYCLDGSTGLVGATPIVWGCHFGQNQEWYSLPSGQLLNGMGNCLENTNTSSTGNFLKLAVCDDSKASQKFAIGKESLDSQQWPDAKVVNRVEIKNSGGSVVRTTGWQDGLQQIGGLSDGNYTVKSQAKDGLALANTSKWSSFGSFTVDSVTPTVTNTRVSIPRISPNSDGLFDQTVLQTTVTDTNLEAVEVQLLNLNQQKVLRTVKFCTLGGSNKPCDRANWTADGNGTVNLSFPIDGKDDAGAVLADGAYQLRVVAKDRSGNRNSLSNSSAWTEMVVDRSSAAISISKPADGSWINTSNLKVYGYVGGYNVTGQQDRDIADFQARLTLSGQSAGVFGSNDLTLSNDDPLALPGTPGTPLTDNLGKFFVYQKTLSTPGTYTLELQSKDLSSNSTTTEGTINQTPVTSWTIKYDPTKPATTIDTPSLSSNQFNFGLHATDNLSGFAPSSKFLNGKLVRTFGSQTFTIGEITQGVVVFGANALALNCSQPNSLTANCTITGTGLDAGNYTFTSTSIDQASNTFDTTTSFTISSGLATTNNNIAITHQIQVNSPTNNLTTTYNSVRVSGSVLANPNQPWPNISAQTWQAKACVREYPVVSNDQYDTSTCLSTAQSLMSLTYGFDFNALLPTNTTNRTFAIDIWATNGTLRTDYVRRVVTLEDRNLLPSASITTDFSGFDTQQKIDDFLDPSKNVKVTDFRKAIFRTEVVDGVQAVDIDFNGTNNLRDLTLLSGTQTPNTRIATISNQPYSESGGSPNGGYVPSSFSTGYVLSSQGQLIVDNTYKQNLASNNSVTPGNQVPGIGSCSPNIYTSPIPENQAQNQNSCVWQYIYKIPTTIGGGVYDAKITAYKADGTNQTTLPFAIDGQLLSIPTLLRVNSGSDGINYPKTTRSLNTTTGSIFYTNQKQIQLKGAADPTAWVKARLLDSSGNEISKDIVQAAQSGFWSKTFTLPDTDGNYKVELQALASISNPNGKVTIPVTYNIVLDRVAPSLTSVQTSVDTNNVNPWIATGRSTTDFNITASELLADGYVAKPDGFKARALATGDSVTNTCGGLQYNQANVANSTYVKTGNNQNNQNTPNSTITNTLYDVTYNKVNTDCYTSYYQSKQWYAKMNQDTQVEGQVNPIIQLEDLAGNQVVVSNQNGFATKDTNGNYTLSLPGLDNSVLRVFVDPSSSFVTSGQTTTVNGQSVVVTDPLPTSYPYTNKPRGKSLDFRLFTDNTRTTRQDWETTSMNLWAKSPDGVGADGVSPELDRLVNDPAQFDSSYIDSNNSLTPTQKQDLKDTMSNYQRTVIRGNSVQLKGLVEKNQRVRVFVEHEVLTPTTSSFEEMIIDTKDTELNLVCPTSNNVGSSNPANDTKTSDNTITKFSDICTFTYNLTLNDNGLSPEGVPINLYQIAYYPIDESGNAPDGVSLSSSGIRSLLTTQFSHTVLLFHDTDNPDYTDISKIKSASYDPIVDWGGTNPITKDTNVTISTVGERQADTQYRITNPTNQILTPQSTTGLVSQDPFSRLARNTSNGKDEQSFDLGNQTRDDNNISGDAITGTCIAMQGTRRIGTCFDGTYKVATRHVDTAGNVGDWVEKSVERDTVGPTKPILSADSIDEDNLNVYLNVNGESNSTVNVSGSTTAQIKLDSTGHGRVRVISANNYTYSTDYSWNVSLQDRAGNNSATATIGFRTKDAPILISACTANTAGKLSFPLESTYPLTSTFGTRKSPITGLDELHNGYDYGTGNQSVNVLAPASGIVQSVGWDSTGGGNMLVIWHPELGIRTGYLHLSQILVKPGQAITKGQKVALSGNTGSQSTGYHLHFSVLTGQSGSWDSTAVNPGLWLKDCSDGSIDNPSTGGQTGSGDESEYTSITCYPINYIGPVQNRDYVNYCYQKSQDSGDIDIEITPDQFSQIINWGGINIPQDMDSYLKSKGVDIKAKIVECALSEPLPNDNDSNWINQTRSGISDFVGFIPALGDLGDTFIAATGTNIISGKQASCIERLLSGAFGPVGLATDGAATLSGAACWVGVVVCSPAAAISASIITEVTQKGLLVAIKQAVEQVLQNLTSQAIIRFAKEALQRFVESGLALYKNIDNLAHFIKQVGSDFLATTENLTLKSMILGGGKALGKIEGKKVVKKGFEEAFNLLTKGLPSVRLAHITEKHAFGTSPRAFKYLEGTNISNLIQEALSKSGRYGPGKSVDYLRNDLPVESIIKEVDMGRVIGKGSDGRNCSIMRIIVSKENEQDILSAFGDVNFKI